MNTNEKRTRKTQILQIITDKKIRENLFNQCYLCSINGNRLTQIKKNTDNADITTCPENRETKHDLSREAGDKKLIIVPGFRIFKKSC